MVEMKKQFVMIKTRQHYLYCKRTKSSVNRPFLDAPCKPANAVLACRAFTLEAATYLIKVLIKSANNMQDTPGPGTSKLL